MYICLHDDTYNDLVCKKMLKDYLEEHKEINIGIIYNQKEECFTDIKGNDISIKGKTIMPYTGVYQQAELIRAIEKHGGISIISEESLKQTSFWPDLYKTKRRTQVVTGRALVDKDFLKYIEEYYGKEIFFKTVNKDYSSVLKVDFLKDDESLIVKSLKHHLDDSFIISEKVDILHDDLGGLEYRCFVINKKVVNISRITDDIMHKIDKKVLEEAQRIVDEVDYENFPDNFVVDIFHCVNKSRSFYDVVEFNSISASGTYLYNTLLSSDTSNILHDDIKSVAPERKKYLSSFKETGKIELVPSKLFDAKKSFARTLKNIRLMGSKDSYLHISGLKLDDNEIKDDILGTHDSLFGNLFTNFNFVDSDEQMSKVDGDSKKNKL